MAAIPPAQRIPPACKTPINISVQHLPVSCVGGPQKKPLSWRVEDEPCHTGAQCGAPPTRTGHGRAVRSLTGATSRGRGQPPQHQLPLNGSDGQRRSGEAAQLPPPATTAASLPRIQPGAVQASRPSARGPGAQGPMLQEEMGRIMPRRPGGGGGTYTDCSRPSEELPPRPSCRASSEPIQSAPATS